MDTYITSDIMEILSGVTNTTSPLYTEAVKNVNGSTEKKLAILKRFMTSINSRGMIDNKEILASKGDIKKYSKYGDIVSGLDKLKSFMGSNKEYKSLQTILTELEKHRDDYVRGYEKKIPLLTLVYESSAFMLIDGVNYLIANCIEVVEHNEKVEMKFKGAAPKGIMTKTINDLAAQLSSKSFNNFIEVAIDTVNKDIVTTEATVFEEASGGSVVTDVVALVERILSFVGKHGLAVVRGGYEIIKAVFNIVPIVRNIIFIYYKHKVDKIERYEILIQFIQMNIDQLNNKKDMDPKEKEKIIKKQKATIQRYTNLANNLRARFTDVEQQVENDVDADNASIRNAEDDFEI